MRNRKVPDCLIACDGSNGRQATKLVSPLQGFGHRVQKSVVEAELDRKELAELLGKAKPYLAGDDSLRLYPLCQSCARSVRSLGRVWR